MNVNDLHHLNSDQIYSVQTNGFFCQNFNQFFALIAFQLTHEVIDDICGISQLQAHKYVPKLWSTEEEFNKFVVNFQILLSNLIDIRNKHEVCIHMLSTNLAFVLL